MIRPLRRSARRPAPTFRPALECLESRDLPAVSVLPFIDPGSGLAGLRIFGDNRSNLVQVTNDSAGHTTVFGDGVTSSFNQQFAVFDIRLFGGNDTLIFNPSGDYHARRMSVLVDLGDGDNVFAFNTGFAQILDHSLIGLAVLGGNRNDFLNINFGPIADSAVIVAAALQGGNETGNIGGGPVPGSITFMGGIRSSSVNVNVDLGPGDNAFQFNFGADLGKLDTFGPSIMNINIAGSDRNGDMDNVIFLATGEANSGSTLNVNVQLRAGNDFFQGFFDANTFEIDDDDEENPFTGGTAHFSVDGGDGNDTITMKSFNQGHTIELTGLFDIDLRGGDGADFLFVDFGGSGGFANDDEEFEQQARNRMFRLHIDGGDGPDLLAAIVSNTGDEDLGATFAYDIAFQGGSGGDLLLFAGSNPLAGKPNGPTFGPAGTVLLDGGFDFDRCAAFGNFPVLKLNCEA